MSMYTGVFLRFIEEMPMGTAEAWHPDRYLSCETIRREIERVHALEPVDEAGPGNGPARTYRIAGTETLIGFITPISANFCAACNRMRITPDGFIRPCLSPCDEYDLKVPLRQGGDDQAIAAVFRQAVGEDAQGGVGAARADAQLMNVLGILVRFVKGQRKAAAHRLE